MIAGILAAFAEHWIVFLITHVGVAVLGFAAREIGHAVIATFLTRLQFWNRR